MSRVAALFEAPLDPDQARALALLMDEGRPTRPAAVETATLLYDGAVGTLVAVWESRSALEHYLATTEVPRGRELMLRIGADPTMRIVDVLEHA